MARVDITVRGAGIFGLSIAWACVQRGAKVRVVDPSGPGAGASGGLVGALAPHVPENWNDKKAFQLDALLLAADWWATVAQVSGQDPGYARLGRVQPLADAQAVARAQARGADAVRIWGDHARWTLRAGGRAFDPPSPSGLVLEDTLSARLNPRRAIGALAAALRACGVDLAAETPDEGAVIWATGAAGLRDLGLHFGRDIGRGEKGQAVSLRFHAADQPQIYADGLHFVPHADGTLAIGSTSERSYADPASTDTLLDDVLQRAGALMPALCDAPVVARWAGERPRARTRAPLLGAWPGRPGHFIANGGFKIGFGIAPKVGQVMADLVLEGHDAIPPDFAPERLMGAA